MQYSARGRLPEVCSPAPASASVRSGAAAALAGPAGHAHKHQVHESPYDLVSDEMRLKPARGR